MTRLRTTPITTDQMEHFIITTEEQAKALRPYTLGKQSVGNIVSPSAGKAVTTHWSEYPESDAITFEQCMAIVRDEVTEDVMWELGDVFTNGIGDITSTVIDKPSSSESDMFLILRHNGRGLIELDGFDGNASLEIPNPTATKLRLLTKILRGE